MNDVLRLTMPLIYTESIESKNAATLRNHPNLPIISAAASKRTPLLRDGFKNALTIFTPQREYIGQLPE